MPRRWLAFERSNRTQRLPGASLHERISDIGEPVPLNPDEERFRLLDAVSQFIISTSVRAPVVLVLDDLHWADGATIAMLRHVARFLPGQRTLLLGAYRDVELDRQHPLADALGRTAPGGRIRAYPRQRTRPS